MVLHNHSTVRASPPRHIMPCMYQHKTSATRINFVTYFVSEAILPCTGSFFVFFVVVCITFFIISIVFGDIFCAIFFCFIFCVIFCFIFCVVFCFIFCVVFCFIFCVVFCDIFFVVFCDFFIFSLLFIALVSCNVFLHVYILFCFTVYVLVFIHLVVGEILGLIANMSCWDGCVVCCMKYGHFTNHFLSPYHSNYGPSFYLMTQLLKTHWEQEIF